MGKREKEHRRKVRNRNQRLAEQQAKIKKELNEAFKEQIEAMREKYAEMSGETSSEMTDTIENEENVQEESNTTGSI